MIRIHERQAERFAEAARAAFERSMAAHLRRFFPREVDALGAGLADRIRRGIDRAAGHGLSTRRDVCKYLSIDLALGPDFDEAPWASSILADRASPTRVARLYEAAIAAADRGPSS